MPRRARRVRDPTGGFPRGARTLLPDRRQREPALAHQLPGEEGILVWRAIPAWLFWGHCRAGLHVIFTLTLNSDENLNRYKQIGTLNRRGRKGTQRKPSFDRSLRTFASSAVEPSVLMLRGLI